jgi:hypothetical protein
MSVWRFGEVGTIPVLEGPSGRQDLQPTTKGSEKHRGLAVFKRSNSLVVKNRELLHHSSFSMLYRCRNWVRQLFRQVSHLALPTSAQMEQDQRYRPNRFFAWGLRKIRQGSHSTSWEPPAFLEGGQRATTLPTVAHPHSLASCGLGTR